MKAAQAVSVVRCTCESGLANDAESMKPQAASFSRNGSRDAARRNGTALSQNPAGCGMNRSGRALWSRRTAARSPASAAAIAPGNL